MSIDRWMDKEDIVLMHSGILAIKRNEKLQRFKGEADNIAFIYF